MAERDSMALGIARRVEGGAVKRSFGVVRVAILPSSARGIP